MAGKVGKAVLEFRTDTGTVLVDVQRLKSALTDLQQQATKSTSAFAGDRIARGMSEAAKAGSVASRVIAAGMAASGRAAKQAADDAQRAKLAIAAEAAAVAKLSHAFSGQSQIQDAQRLVAAVAQIGGATKLTANEQKQANAIVAEAIAKYRALGQQAPQSLLELDVATRKVETSTGAWVAIGTMAAHFIESLISRVVTVGKESVVTAARTQGLVAVAQFLGQRTGATKDRIDGLIQSLNKQGLTMQQSANLIVQLSRANLGLENATKLASVAQNASFISGMSSSDALEHIITGIVTLQPQLLHTAGLMVSLDQSERAYAKQNGRTVESLSAFEKQQIALNATLEAGEAINGTYGLSMQFVGKQLTSLPRYVEDAESSVGDVFLPTLGVGVHVATELLKVIREYPKAFVAATSAILAVGATVGLGAAGVIAYTAGWIALGAAVLGGIGLLTKYVSEVESGETAMRRFADAQGRSVEELTSSQQATLKLAGQLTDARLAQVKVAEATGRTTDQLSDQEKATIDNTASWNRWIEVMKLAWRYMHPYDRAMQGDRVLMPLPPLPASPKNPFPQPAPYTGPLNFDDLATMRDRSAAVATEKLIDAQRRYRQELAEVGPQLKTYVEHMHELGMTEKEIAQQLHISEDTVRTYKDRWEEAARASKTSAKQFADAMGELSSAGDGWEGTLETISGAVAEAIRYYHDAGVSQEALAHAYGLTSTQINAVIKALDNERDWTKAVLDVRKEMHALALELNNELLKKQREQAERTGTIQLESIQTTFEAEQKAAEVSKQIQFARAEYAINQARRWGASDRQVMEMEIALSHERARAALADIAREYDARKELLELQIAALDANPEDAVAAATARLKRAELASFQREHDLRVQQIVEADRLAENEKRAEYVLTHNVALRLLNDLQVATHETVRSISDGVAGMLVGIEHSWADTWQSMQRIAQQVLANLLNNILTNFLTGLMQKMASAKLGQAVGGLLGGGGGGGGLGLATNATSVAGLFGGGSAVSASFLASAPGLGATGPGIVAGEGLAGIGGGAAGGAGLSGSLGFLANPAFWTNPWTIGIGAAIGGFFLARKLFGHGEEKRVNDRKDKFFGQFVSMFGGKPYDATVKGFQKAHVSASATDTAIKGLYAAKKEGAWESAERRAINLLTIGGLRGIQFFNHGGFVMPGSVIPAVLHGGSRGELVTPMDKFERIIKSFAGQGRQIIVQAPMYVQGLIDGGNARELHEKHMRRFMSEDLYFNHGWAADVARAR